MATHDLPYHIYPFLSGAKAATQEIDINLGEVTAEQNSNTVDRAVHRVRSAITDGTNGRDDFWDDSIDTDVELLSYPLSRILVSLLDDDVIQSRFVAAETNAAISDLDTRLSNDTDDGTAILSELFAELGLGDDVTHRSNRRAPDEYVFPVTRYLNISATADSEDWDIRSRGVSDGNVIVSEQELPAFLETTIRTAVSDGLPISVPDALADNLAVEVAKLSTAVQEIDRAAARDVTGFNLDTAPAAIKGLIVMSREDEHTLTEFERYTLVSYLAVLNVTDSRVVDLLELEEGSPIAEYTLSQLHTLRGDTDADSDGHGTGSLIRPPSYGALVQSGELSEDTREYDTPLAGDVAARRD